MMDSLNDWYADQERQAIREQLVANRAPRYVQNAVNELLNIVSRREGYEMQLLISLQGENYYRLYGFHIFGAVVYTGSQGGERVGRTWGASPVYEQVMTHSAPALGSYLNDVSALFR